MTQETTSMTEMNLPATKGDFVRLENKVDTMTTSVGVLSTAVAVLQSKPEYKQPCADYCKLEQDYQDYKKEHSPCTSLKEHIEEHKSLKKDWRSGIISLIITVIGACLIGIIGFLAAMIHLEKS